MPAATEAPGVPFTHRGSGRSVRPLYLAVSVIWLAVMLWLLRISGAQIWEHASVLVLWVAVLAFVNLVPIPAWNSANFAADLPIAIAAALVLAPAETALVSFLGAFDPRELRREVSPTKAVWNRSQVGLAAFLGSWIVHSVAVSPDASRMIVLLSFLALAVASVTNYLLVATALSIESGQGPHQILKSMKLGTLPDFALTFVAWGVLAAMLSALYKQIGPAALVAFLGPTMLGRQVLMRSQMWIDSRRAYRSREKALTRLSSQIEEERTDERRLIAADLHDEVLQPLYKVTLMSQVIKADLATGKLLEIDDDLPELLAAADIASRTLRELIGDLRRSTLGRGGLAPALVTLARRFQGQTAAEIVTAVRQLEVDERKQLAMYQIAKEALLNAIQHSRATHIWLRLDQSEDEIRLEVEDDGVGFEINSARESHFGLHIMGERANAIGARLYIDTAVGNGCHVTVALGLLPVTRL